MRAYHLTSQVTRYCRVTVPSGSAEVKTRFKVVVSSNVFLLHMIGLIGLKGLYLCNYFHNNTL